jgi:hypothetical protein
VLGKKAQVFSVNPGVIMTPLGANIDWAGEFGDISEFSILHEYKGMLHFTNP